MAINVLKSKLGRNTFLLSSAIAAVPLIAVGLISLAQINKIFDARNREYLDESARAYGRIVYERLLLAAESLPQIEPGGIRRTEIAQIDGVAYYSAEGAVSDSGMALSSELVSVASVTQRATLHFESGNNGSEAYVIRPTANGSVIGRISQDYLWGDPTEFPYAVDYCVLASGSEQPVFCSSSLPADAMQSVRKSDTNAGLIEWNEGPAPMNSAFWELFTHSAFDGPLLRIVATRPAEVGLAQWTTFLAIYSPVLAITIGLVLLASSAHVRRILRPLNALLSATKKFSQGELTARAEVERSDEFADLASAMNSMADRLRAHLDTLKRLSEIDQIILGGKEIDEVADLVLMQATDAAGVACAAIAILDQDLGEDAVWHCRRAGHDSIDIVRLGLDQDTRHALEDRCGTLPLNDLTNTRIRQLFASYGAVQVLGISVLIGNGCHAFLFLGGESLEGLPQETLDRSRDLGSRLAVAIESRRREVELVRRATIDGLTGLPNRELLRDRLEQGLIQARKGSFRLSVAFIDLDRFKNVNDALGHSSGDELLRQAARRLVQCIGETDTVARLGGDEFVVISAQHSESDSIEKLSTQILDKLSQPFTVGSDQIFISASIGTASFPRDGDNVDTLLRKADLAMYAAKDAGRDQVLGFTMKLEERIAGRVNLEADLNKALDREEFSLVYQPQYQLATGKCFSAEALIRWHHPTRGMVSPAHFIPLAEELGFIKILGAWVMSSACHQLKQWHDDGIPIERIAVNVSAGQFGQADFVSQVESCIASAGISPEFLELEITESVFIRDLEKTIGVLKKIRALGISIAIDDFGTGYSSMSYLRQLPFDIVKIDRAFVKDIPDSLEACAIASAVTAMAATLKKSVIAEGIETEQQMDYLRQLGVEFGQGYLFAKPLTAEEFMAYLDPSLQQGQSCSAVAKRRAQT